MADLISPATFYDSSAQINLFDNMSVVVSWLAHDPLVVASGAMHRADPSSCNGCSVGISQSGSQLNGFAYIDGRQYSIETNNSFNPPKYLISELRRIESESTKFEGSDAIVVKGIAASPLLLSQGGSTIDLLVLVTPQLLALEPQLPQLPIYVGVLNNALAISNVNKTVRVVGIRTVAANLEGIDARDTVENLWRNGDGVLDEVHAYRDQLGADLVFLLANNTRGISGAAIELLQTDVYTANSGFAAGEYSRPTQQYYSPFNMAHEIGHNLGTGHIYPSASGYECGGIYPYSCGHRLSNLTPPGAPAARTIMTYQAWCQPTFPCDEIPSYSDPLVFFRGQRTGIANLADNGRTLRQTAEYISNLRPSGGLGGQVELRAAHSNAQMGNRVGAIQQFRMDYQIQGILGRATNAVVQFNFTESLNRAPRFYRIVPTPFTVAATSNSSVGNCSGMQSPVGTVECTFSWIDTQALLELPFIVEYSSAGLELSFTFKLFADQIDLNPSNNTIVSTQQLPYPAQN